MLSQKIRNNASISYFFLGWLFLLAKNNPNFSDPFIRQHAKIATKVHGVFFGAYFFYSHFLSGFLSYSVPILQITLDRCIDIAFFATLTIFIIRWVHRSQKDTSHESIDNNGTLSLEGRTFRFSWASEAQRIILLLSHVPFLGMIIATRYPSIVTTTGARVSSVFSLLYLFSYTTEGFWSLSMVLLFVGVLGIVFLAARFFLHDSHTIPQSFEKIPKMESLYQGIRAFPGYFADIGQMIFGKKDAVSFTDHLERIRESDRNFRISLQEYFTDETLPFKPFWIFVPFCNLVFLPRLLSSRTTKYVLAIGQGLIITLLGAAIGYFFSFTSPLELFLLFPVFYGIAALESDTFMRIPLIYEIYATLNALTFGLLKSTKRMRSVQKRDMEISFKLD